MKPWNQQIDELVEAGAYADALSLLDSLDAALVADKVRDDTKSLFVEVSCSPVVVGTETEADSRTASSRPVPQCEVRRGYERVH